MLERIRIYRQNRQYIHLEKRELKTISQLACDSRSLRRVTASEIQAIFKSPSIEQEWTEISDTLNGLCNITDGATGAVNPGDRRALYYLIRGFHARNVLEIGTHVGASTLHIAAAMARERQDKQEILSLVSVDIEDVNDESQGPWRRFGLDHSPIAMLHNTGCADFVRFIAQKSLDFLPKDPVQNYDLIFLDGSHAASVVYQEIPLALRSLAENGVILLHDFFPQNKPLWSLNRGVIPGPWIATQRLRAEGARILVIPLGALPWPSKLGSNVTSLALLTKE
jgi:predicted O-methyltransferase YrrM